MRPSPIFRVAGPLALAILSAGPLVYGGDDLGDRTIPGKWFESVAPEKLPALKFPSYDNTLDKAKLEVVTGRFKLALSTIATLKSPDPAAVAPLRGNALAAIGRYDEALKVLDTPGTQVDRAKVLMDLGRYDEARAAIEKFIAANPKSLDAHYQLGRVAELQGDLDAAAKAYAWFTEGDHNYLAKWRRQPDQVFPDDAAALTIVGRALSRWALLSNAYATDGALHNQIMGMFVHAYDVVDRDYWPARTAAGEFLLSHDEGPKAATVLLASHEANPNDPGTLKLLAQIALDRYSFGGVDKIVDELRTTNPDSAMADLLEARNLLLQQYPKEAEEPVNRVLARQPKNLEALGLLAATKALQLKDDEAAGVLKRVEAIDPDNASAYVEVAEQLGTLRQYPRAEAMYKIAIRRAPWWTGAQNDLGLLLTQSGDEDRARAVLDAAYKVDPYNLKTTNYLRLLDKLDSYAHDETAHFIIVYDPKTDPIIPQYFGAYLESAYAAVTGDFKFEPAVKTYIEVFPTHDAFSVRTTGTPWLPTVGASTGRVIALVAPRKGAKTMGPFNWAQVLRHEFTHTVTLGETDNRIPHWFTEGLAVWEEHTPVRWEWVPMLYHAITTDTMFPLDQLTWGFVRPKKPIDRQLAYAESEWICTYIEQTYGHDAILKMLGLFRQGLTQEQVFTKVFSRSQSQFFTEFMAWCRSRIATWGYDKETSAKYDELKKQGEELIAAREYAAAVPVWEAIEKIRPVDELPHKRLAGLYLTKDVHEPLKAVDHLLMLQKLELKDNQWGKRAARVLRDANELDRAERVALDAVYVDPYDESAHELLEEIRSKKGDAAGAAKERQTIEVLEKLKEAPSAE